MRKILLIAISNFKKKRGAMFTIGILIAFSCLLLYISLSTFLGCRLALDTSARNSNLADFNLCAPSEFKDEISDYLDTIDNYEAYEITNCALAPGAKCAKDSSLSHKKEISPLFASYEKTRNISKITCDTSNIPENGIILCQYNESADGVKVGDPYFLICKDHTYELTVAGFSEDALFSTPLNINIQKFFVSDELLATLLRDNTDIVEYFDCRILINCDSNTEEYEDEFMKDIYHFIPEITNSIFYAVNKETMSHGVLIMPNIAMSIILVFGMLLMLIALSVIYYNIKNFIEEDLPNIGILKASGYTSTDLRWGLLIELMIVTVLGALLGILIGVIGTPIIGNILAGMMGIIWRLGPNGVAAFASVLIVFFMVIVTVLFLTRRYKHIFVLDALRGGISSHNFKKNPLPLENSPLPLTFSIGIKALLFEKRKNIVVTLIIAILSFASCMSVFMYINFGKNDDSIILISGLEYSEVILSTSDTKIDSFDPTSIEGIINARYGNNADFTVSHDGSNTSANIDIWLDPSTVRNEMLIKGRMVENSKEIVLSAGVAKAINASIGDVIYLENNTDKCDFMIVGIDQKVNHLGKKGIVSLEGIRRLVPSINPAVIYLDVADGYSYDMVKDDVQAAFHDSTLNDGKGMVSSTISGIKTIMTSLCLFFLITTAIIVFMILYMIGKSKIIEERKQLGIDKALGFTTSQLIRKNVISIIPIVMIGGIIGIVSTIFLANPMVSLFLSTMGFGKCSYPAAPFLYVLVVFFIVADALCVTILTSSKIRHIEPVKMIQEQ